MKASALAVTLLLVLAVCATGEPLTDRSDRSHREVNKRELPKVFDKDKGRDDMDKDKLSPEPAPSPSKFSDERVLPGKWDVVRLRRLAMSGDPFPFSVCSGAPTDLSIAHVDVTPDPPVAGHNITIWAYGSVDEELTQGSQVVISVSYMGIQIFTETIPMSDVTSMPVGPGLVDINYSIGIPDLVPHGPYSVSLTFNDQTGTEITCLLIQFSL